MKTIETQAAQGDLYIRRVDTLPAKATPIAATGGRHVVAHSETGHDHYVAAIPGAEMLDIGDPMICYLRLAEPCDLVHARPFDTHETLRLGAGLWEVRRQREMTPDGWARVED